MFSISPDHYSVVVMGTLASQIASLTNVYPILHSGADQRKPQSSASLALVREIHRRPVNSPHKWPVTRNMFQSDDVIMNCTIDSAASGRLDVNFSKNSQI